MHEETMQLVAEMLSQTFGEQVSIHNSNTVGGGCINNASKLQTSVGTMFFKWNANCRSDMFLREAESLKELTKAANGMLKVPEVFSAKEVDETPGFLLLEYLEADYAGNDIDEKLGRGLAVIHQCGADKFGFYSDNYCGATIQDNRYSDSWGDFFRNSRLNFLLNLVKDSRPLSTDDRVVFDKLLDKVPELIPKGSTPSLIHGDLWSGNYMSTSVGPALIDPAAYYADREMEFAIITMFGGFSSAFFDAYNEVNPLPPDWRSRNPLYQLYHILNHYYLFGGGYLQQAIRVAKRFI